MGVPPLYGEEKREASVGRSLLGSWIGYPQQCHFCLKLKHLTSKCGGWGLSLLVFSSQTFLKFDALWVFIFWVLPSSLELDRL